MIEQHIAFIFMSSISSVLVFIGVLAFNYGRKSSFSDVKAISFLIGIPSVIGGLFLIWVAFMGVYRW